MAMRLFLFCLCCLSMQAYSQDATRPTHKVGDKWLVERFDLWKKEVTSSRESRVAEISASSLTIELKDAVSGKVTTVITDLDGNTLEFEGRKFDSPVMAYSFPLAIGKKWKFKFGGPNSARNGTFTEERACEVLAFEDVVTKPGTFKAYKIKCDGAYTNTDVVNRWSGQTFSTRWYSPEVRNFVKHEYKDTGPRGLWNQYVDQLVSFELQK
jgi:hypothetical protein